MLKKLLKYELMFLVKDFLRTYILYGIVSLIVSLMLLVSRSASGSTAFGTLFGIFLCIYAVFTAILAFSTMMHNVKRFKKNMFSHEGYLTNTLPVTPAQHVIAKLIAGAINYVVSFIAIYLSLMLIFACSGNLDDVRRVLGYLVDRFSDFGLLFPTFLMFATGFLAFLLCCYLLTSVGSMIGGSKGASVILGVMIAVAYIFVTTFINAALDRAGIRSAAASMYIFSLFYALCAVGEFLIVINIIKNKLNLQ